jgi:hypothetical protein
MISCILTPYDIAFPDVELNNISFSVALYLIDFIFLIDICLTFFSAIEDKDKNTIDNLK